MNDDECHLNACIQPVAVAGLCYEDSPKVVIHLAVDTIQMYFILSSVHKRSRASARSRYHQPGAHSTRLTNFLIV